METINKPMELVKVQCYNCKQILHVHPLEPSHSERLTDCSNGHKITKESIPKIERFVRKIEREEEIKKHPFFKWAKSYFSRGE